MKKSKFNIFRKIDGNMDIVFNSFSLAIAEADQVFSKIYNNLENLDINKFSEIERDTYDTMINCKFIVDDKVDEMRNLEFFRHKLTTSTATFYLTIYPTLNCNFDCYYCYEKNKTGIISKKVQQKILELVGYHAERKSNIEVIWHGGEPLLTFDIICYLSENIINICKKNNVKYSCGMTTNGYLFTDDIISKLIDYNLKTVLITLDGPPEMHNKRRYLKNTKTGTFDKILENAIKLKKNNIKVKIRTNLNKDFNTDIMLKLVNILEKNDLTEDFAISFENDNSYIKTFKTKTNCFSINEFAGFALHFYKKLHSLGIKNLKDSFFPQNDSFNLCKATLDNAIFIDPAGYFYKCPLDVGLPQKAIGTILENAGFNENYFNNNVRYVTWSPFKFDKCNNCNLIPICSGNCINSGINKNDEPECIWWKYVIEDLIDEVARNILREKKYV